MASPDRHELGRRAALIMAAGAAVLAVAAYLLAAFTLVGYPFDWDTGEGLNVDYARRLMQAPATLYPHDTVVPLPLTYGPLYSLLLAPLLLVARDEPLAAARLLSLLCAAASCAAVYVLVRRRAGRTQALVCAALIPAHATASFWLALARVDGLMIALWLWAGVAAMPERLARGGSSLSWRRAIAGAVLLVLAVFTKPTAVVLGAPLVLGWLAVDRRSAVRLAAVTGGLGAAAFAALQIATHGGFWWSLQLQAHMPTQPGQTLDLTVRSLTSWWGPLALSALGFGFAWRRRDGTWRDGTWLLVAAGPLTVPLLSKFGASLNYALPWACAQAALAGRLLGAGRAQTPVAAAAPVPVAAADTPAGAAASSPATDAPAALAGMVGSAPAAAAGAGATAGFARSADDAAAAPAAAVLRPGSWPLASLAAVAGAGVLAALLATQSFPLPTQTDRRTAETFYAFVRARGAPLLAASPDYAYVVVGQNVLIEWSTFPALATAKAPGTEDVLRGLGTPRYRLLVERTDRWHLAPRGYRAVAACALGYFFGPTRNTLFVPTAEADAVIFPIAEGARCLAARAK